VKAFAAPTSNAARPLLPAPCVGTTRCWSARSGRISEADRRAHRIAFADAVNLLMIWDRDDVPQSLKLAVNSDLTVVICAIISIIATALLPDCTNKDISTEAHYEEPL
jgi:hypothetical protein